MATPETAAAPERRPSDSPDFGTAPVDAPTAAESLPGNAPCGQSRAPSRFAAGCHDAASVTSPASRPGLDLIDTAWVRPLRSILMLLGATPRHGRPTPPDDISWSNRPPEAGCAESPLPCRSE
jgi:hypothetical protein